MSDVILFPNIRRHLRHTWPFVPRDSLGKTDPQNNLTQSVRPIEHSDTIMTGSSHTSYLSILVHRRIIEVYKKYTKKLSELATK